MGKKRSSGWESVLADAGSTRSGEITRPFASSAWVHSAINFVTNPISGLPLIFTEDRRGGDVRIEDPALTTFWERPGMTRGAKRTGATSWRRRPGGSCSRGRRFRILDDLGWRVASRVRLILALRQDLHEITSGAGRELIGWNWTDGRGARHALIPEQVIHIKKWNPYDDIRGLADWEAARIAADADYAAGLLRAQPGTQQRRPRALCDREKRRGLR